MSCFLEILGWIFCCVDDDDEHRSYRPLKTAEPPLPSPPTASFYYSPSNHLGLKASSKPPPSSLPSSSKHHAQSSSSSSPHLSSSSSRPSPTSRPSSNPFASSAPPKATAATLGFSSEASHSESIGPSFQKNEIPKHFELQVKVSSRLPCVGSVHDQCSSQKSPLLPQTVGRLKPIKMSQDSNQVSSGSLPLISSTHDQSVQKSSKEFSGSHSDSCLKTISISQGREKESKPLPLISPIHDQSANELSELSKSIKKPQMKKPSVNPLPNSKLVSVESSKKSHQVLTESFGITEPVKISRGKQTISPPSPYQEMLEPLHVSESIKKLCVKGLVLKSSPLTKSFCVPSDDILQNHPAHVHTQKRINSDENAVVHSLPLLSSIHDQSVQKSPQKFSAKDISDSSSETVGYLKPIKISQYREKVSKSDPLPLDLPLDTPVHDQSANELSELSKPIKNSQMKKTVVNPFPKTKLVWVESSKKSHQILTESFGITKPEKISKERQTISPPSPYQEMLEPLHVSKSIKKLFVKGLVVKSSPLTKSVWVPSDENLQTNNTQKCTSSDENVGVHSLPPKKIWVKKSPQQGQIEEREEPISISLDKKPTAGSPVGLSFCKKYGTDSMEAQVGNEIDEESMQFSRTVRGKKYKLPVYPVPEHLRDLIEKDIVPKVLRKPLSPSTYTDYFAALLYAEDFYIEKWTDFILLDVTLELHEEHAKKGSANSMSHSSDDDKKVFVKFEIDSVPERRPFLLSRDFIFLQHSGKKSRTFEGSFYRVMKSTHVLAEFGDDFYSQYSANDRYDVSFSFNRVCLKRCHQAIASAMNPSFRHVLFPDKLCCSDLSVENADDYGSIVHKITTMQGGRPYLIRGPLSTHSYVVGYTVTKAVLQICRKSPSHRILICAPKNKTCDELAAILNEEIPDSELFRANAAFRDVEDVDGFVMPLCAYDGECFITPSLSELEEFRVVTSTYVSSFRLHNCGISAGHFTHIFLVDASGATEPESMIPLANLAGEKTAIVVTGCVHDRPPRVRSHIARWNGLRRSYFHRLLESYLSSSSDYLFDAYLN